jgi:hypothetical protein
MPLVEAARTSKSVCMRHKREIFARSRTRNLPLFSQRPSPYIDWDTAKPQGVTSQKAIILDIVASAGTFVQSITQLVSWLNG